MAFRVGADVDKFGAYIRDPIPKNINVEIQDRLNGDKLSAFDCCHGSRSFNRLWRLADAHKLAVRFDRTSQDGVSGEEGIHREISRRVLGLKHVCIFRIGQTVDQDL